ncbi:MAG: SusC/RagA family TonB-linked outer membrane protein, partial [Saprospiraceae bacterium]|nr:SusC/RagA family TonB-linked outer membrane protein [Saprospiraceae bacterium]
MKFTTTKTSDVFRTKLFLWCLLMSIPLVGFSANTTSDASLAMTVTGTVLSEEGDPLIGVTVLEEGTSNGTVTDFDGTYSLEVQSGDASLQFSYTGFKTTTVPVMGKGVIDVTMEVEVSSLDEVVVIGYGSTKKANLTGAVSVISNEELERRPIASLGQGLQGLIPNLNVSIRNGDPTRGADFNIRGYESINGGSPLILVDGVPMDIERINPNDIKSINVLKDASAAAVYGARAAFGVILIETKKGKEGKVNIQLSSELSAANPIFNMDPITDPYQFALARNRASMRTNGTPSYTDEWLNAFKAYSEGTGPEWEVVDGVLRYYGYNDYQNSLMTNYAPQQKYDLSASGATESANYYVSFGMLNKDGYLKDKEHNENFKRYNALMKADFQVSKWLKLEEKVVFNSQVSDKPHFYNWDVNINTVARVSPILPIQFPDLDYYLTPGDHEEFAPYIGQYFGSLNFFPYLQQGGRETFTKNDLWLTQGVTLTPIEGLRIKGDFSYNTYTRTYQDVASKIEAIESTDIGSGVLVGNGFSGNDWINNVNNYNQYYVFNTYAEYTLDKIENHFIKGMIGFNQEWGRFTFARAQANSLITPLVPDLNATTGTQQTFGGKEQVALRGVFYRLNYIYKDKYLFEANGRYDGTSRFPTDDRFGFFPSFSVGWRVSEEGFMAGTRDFLDNLKLRASYGTLGNQILTTSGGSQIYYPYISTLGSGTSPYMMSSAGRIPIVTAAGLV